MDVVIALQVCTGSGHLHLAEKGVGIPVPIKASNS